MLMGNPIDTLDHTRPSVAAMIYRLFQRAYTVEANLLGVSNFPPLSRTPERIQNANRQFIGSYDGGVLTAALEYHQLGMRLLIDSVVVDPNYFRQGLAKHLLLTVLRDTTWQSAEVETATANTPAIALYRGLGFQEIRRFHTPQGIEKVVFERIRRESKSDAS